jgi:hypothetical protein
MIINVLFADWIEIIDTLGTLGILILIAYSYRSENEKAKKDLKDERDARILDLKSHNESSENLLEKTLIALQDNQRFLEKNHFEMRAEIKENLKEIIMEIKTK